MESRTKGNLLGAGLFLLGVGYALEYANVIEFRSPVSEAEGLQMPVTLTSEFQDQESNLPVADMLQVAEMRTNLTNLPNGIVCPDLSDRSCEGNAERSRALPGCSECNYGCCH